MLGGLRKVFGALKYKPDPSLREIDTDILVEKGWRVTSVIYSASSAGELSPYVNLLFSKPGNASVPAAMKMEEERSRFIDEVPVSAERASAVAWKVRQAIAENEPSLK